ncbi:MAG: hypothetical protein SGPRY_013437 [Prymnesium sp.]
MLSKGPEFREAALWGTDDNKLAVRYAAKRHKTARFAVAPPHRLPLASGSMDLVLSAFAPAVGPVREEFHRVLRPGGAVVVARAGREHLKELRALAGGPPWRPPKESTQGFGENYSRIRTEEHFSESAARSLLAMTPMVRDVADKEKQAAMEKLASAGELVVTA